MRKSVRRGFGGSRFGRSGLGGIAFFLGCRWFRMGFADVDIAVAICVERFEDLRRLVDFFFGKFAVAIGVEQGE